jgi:hypothetical protein
VKRDKQKGRRGGASSAAFIALRSSEGSGNDLSGLGEGCERDGCEDCTGGEDGEELGHGMISQNCLEADQATICEAWFNTAKATGANTAQAAIRAKNLVI